MARQHRQQRSEEHYHVKVFVLAWFWKTARPWEVTPSWTASLLWSCFQQIHLQLVKTHVTNNYSLQKLNQIDECVFSLAYRKKLFNDNFQPCQSQQKFPCWRKVSQLLTELRWLLAWSRQYLTWPSQQCQSSLIKPKCSAIKTQT